MTEFDLVKTSFLQFLLGWTLQGFWITFTSAAAIGSSLLRSRLGVVAILGLAVWAAGFIFEIVADRQSRFEPIRPIEVSSSAWTLVDVSPPKLLW